MRVETRNDGDMEVKEIAEYPDTKEGKVHNAIKYSIKRKKKKFKEGEGKGKRVGGPLF